MTKTMTPQDGNGPRIEIYQKTWCPYSRAALRLLDRKGVTYENIDVTDDPAREAEMIARSGRTSVPEIFIDGRLVGGYDALCAMEQDGRLERLLEVADANGQAAA